MRWLSFNLTSLSVMLLLAALPATVASSAVSSTDQAAAESQSASCGCKFDHTCFPDKRTLKNAVNAFIDGTWTGELDGVTYGPIEEFCTGNISDMKLLFEYKDTFNADISQWDTSSVTDMYSMFYGASSFDGRGIGRWDVSKVTDMGAMFYNAASFTGNIEDWNTSSVTNMGSLFTGAKIFAGSLDKWDTSSVNAIAGMFARTNAFTGEGIGAWDVSKVTQAGGVFAEATAFNGSIEDWDVSSVFAFTGMFEGATKFNKDLSGWPISSAVFVNDMFKGAKAFNQDLCSWGKDFPYINQFGDPAKNVFANSGCKYTKDPKQKKGGPFCAAECKSKSNASAQEVLDAVDH